MEAVRSTILEQEAVFRQQLEELHRLYNKQRELMDEVRRTLLASSTRKRVKKPELDFKAKRLYLNELIDIKDKVAPVTPETANSSKARGKQVLSDEEQARSAAETLIAMSMSSSFLTAAKTVTSAKSNADLASVQLRTQPMKMPGGIDLASGQRSAQEMKMPGQHEKCSAEKKHKRIGSSWGMIKKGRRSQRKRDRNPLHTFQRGAILSRWR